MDNARIQSHTRGFNQFVMEANAKALMAIGYCSNLSICRTQNELLYIAYGKSKIIQEELKFDHMFIFSVQPNLNFNGISHVIMTSPTALGMKKGNISSSLIFKYFIY